MHRSLLWSAVALSGACGGSLSCPEGTKPVGAQCRTELTAASDGADAQAPETDSGLGREHDASRSESCASEVCDGRDNDCDGKVDQGFQCAFGSTRVPCATRCGSIGAGPCTADCREPDATVCVAPAETCNTEDDDCDGAVDEQTYGRLRVHDALLTQQVSAPSFAQVGLSARPLNGMWAFARAEGARDGATDLIVMSLEPTGWTFKSAASAATRGATYFAVDGDRRVVALASRVISAAGRSLAIYLFDANQLSLLSSHVLFDLSDSADDVTPIDVSVISEGEVRHVAVVYGSYDDDRVPQYGTGLRVASYESGVGWISSAELALGTLPGPDGAALERVACRNEWLLAQADGSTSTLKLVSSSGVVIATGHTEARKSLLAGFAAGEDRCAVEDSLFALLFQDGWVERFRVGRDDGHVERIGNAAQLGMKPRHASLTQREGKWFLAGSDYGGDPNGTQTVKELTFSDSAASVRDLPLAVGGGLDPGGLGRETELLPNQTRVGARSAVGALENAIVVALPSSFSGRGNLQARLSAVSPGTTLSAIAATYQMGCF